jgi:AraC-like DNA-binding protein
VVTHNKNNSTLPADLGKVSMHAVKQYLQLAQAQNLDICPILADLGMSTDLLSDNSQYITGKQFQALISALLKLSNDKLFGLHTAKFVQPSSYSVLGYISMNCKTLGEAITKIQSFEQLVGDMGTTNIEQQGQCFKIGWDCHFTDSKVKQQMIDNCLASWLTFARYLINNQGQPIKVMLSRDEPELSQQHEYQIIFDCPVQFNQSENAILFDASLLELPLNKGDQLLLSTLESHAEALISSITPDVDLVSQVSNEIKKSLTKGSYLQTDIAKALGLGAKTLQRRLNEQNQTFQILLDQTRLSMAEDLLKQGQLSVNQISEALGFVESRSFFRWFKKLTQQTPGEYRSRL